jgi:succinate dehydrogenase assembly factor 2
MFFFLRDSFIKTCDFIIPRLIYQSRKRGMLENGLLLATFASKYLEQFDEKQTALYDRLINLPTNDWDIFYWATGVKETPVEYDNEIMKMLKLHVANADKEERFHQPNLY